MKLSYASIAAAVAVALGSTAANAQLAAPTQNTGAAPTTSTLYVAVWDTTSNATELVNLSYSFSQANAAGALTPNSAADPNAVNYVTAANPTGAAGSVLQLNFGILANFATDFPTTSATTTNYLVLAPNGSSTTTGAADLFTFSGAAPTFTPTALTTFSNNAFGEINAWNSTTPVPPGNAYDAKCTTVYCFSGASINNGSMGLTGTNFAGAIGTALNFFNVTASTTRGGSPSQSQFANSTGSGFWYLSNTGDLTWNVPIAASAVPLPAAGWLLVSGLLGLGAVGRRRLAA